MRPSELEKWWTAWWEASAEGKAWLRERDAWEQLGEKQNKKRAKTPKEAKVAKARRQELPERPHAPRHARQASKNESHIDALLPLFNRVAAGMFEFCIF